MTEDAQEGEDDDKEEPKGGVVGGVVVNFKTKIITSMIIRHYFKCVSLMVVFLRTS